MESKFIWLFVVSLSLVGLFFLLHLRFRHKLQTDFILRQIWEEIKSDEFETNLLSNMDGTKSERPPATLNGERVHIIYTWFPEKKREKGESTVAYSPKRL